MILVGDIGGTNSRLALFSDELQLVRESTTPSGKYQSFVEIVDAFFRDGSERGQVTKACFGVAGPVTDGEVKLTNLNWHLSERELEKELGIGRVALINDLVAHAEGVEMLKPEQLIVLNTGQPNHRANRCVIAAGTGLGEAGLFFDVQANGYKALGCEGGHADFAPRSDREYRLFEFLRSRGKPASWESVLSGPGLRNIYDFLVSPGEMGVHAGLPTKKDPSPAQITKAALDGSNSACVAAVEMFAAFYAAEAGNLALKLLALNGVYLGGGIAPTIVEKLRTMQFMTRFEDKGPGNIRGLLKKNPDPRDQLAYQRVVRSC